LAEACGLVCPSAWLGADEPAHRKGLCNRHLMPWSFVTEAVPAFQSRLSFNDGRSQPPDYHYQRGSPMGPLCEYNSVRVAIKMTTARA
jgi:hypothetical protein